MSDPAAATGGESVSHAGLISRVALLGTATLMTKFVALAKDLFVAKQLGAGDALDAYLVALVLPSYAAVVLAHTFAAAFVPAYVRVWKSDGLETAKRFAGSVLAVALLVLFITTFALAVMAPWLVTMVGSGFDPAKRELAIRLLYPMLTIVAASGLSAVFAAVLNAHERFLAVAVAPMAIPVATLFVYWQWQIDYGVQSLAVGTAVGFLGETLVLTTAVWGTKLFPILGRTRDLRHRSELTQLFSQYLPVVFGGMLMSSAMVVDQSMAASLGPGQVSVLNYGGKVVAVVLTIVAASLSTVLFPRFTHLIAIGRITEFRSTFRLYAIGVVLLSIPFVAFLAAITQPTVRLLFERGAFTPETTVAVSRIQWCLLPQIPFYVLALLGSRVLSALDGNATVLRIAATNVAVNIVGNYVLMQYFGIEGIATATSLMYVVATVFTLVAIRQKLAVRADVHGDI